MTLIEKAKYGSLKATHTFANCALNRAEYGEFLADYLVGEKDGFVLNINGAWGTGKTEFLKRMYTHLLERNYPTIYIDAWESDFSNVPLSVITSELITQLESFSPKGQTDKQWKRTKKCLGALLKTSVSAISVATTGTLVGQELLALLNNPETLTDRVTQAHASQVEALAEVKLALAELADNLRVIFDSELPIIVLVDELDRCRPTYAIEMLEVIKHFFNTKHFVFAVATDSDQLCCSIKAVYGNDFNAAQYLKRFFDRKINLPEPDLHQYIQTLDVFSPDPNAVELMEVSGVNRSLVITKLVEAYNLKIRDIDQLISKLNACLRSAEETHSRQNNKQIINFSALVIGLIEHHREYESFYTRRPNQVEYQRVNKPEILWCEDVRMDDYIKATMSYVYLKEVSSTNEWGDTTMQCVFPKARDILTRYDHSSIKRNELIETLVMYARYFGQSTAKYWLWPDYQKVIELAGYIE
ncbi:P-loop ATPase [Vibrio metschnikovii]|uniref:KAP family NTPase n=1 Tax=bacterium 19CA03SA04 TaxID=2920698 RepID=A0AAU6T1A3_UNCXX|nr:P-loop NTPase fold protein [Vibrio metschnikovii]SUP49413.1 P-loop ATPase [Vibrio metschnikovii]